MLGLIVWIAEPDSERVGLDNMSVGPDSMRVEPESMSVGPDSMSSGQDSVFFQFSKPTPTKRPINRRT